MALNSISVTTNGTIHLAPFSLSYFINKMRENKFCLTGLFMRTESDNVHDSLNKLYYHDV